MAKTSEISRRDLILDAAEKAFGHYGFEGASLRQIVSDAGVNLATVYYYFDSKEGLLAAVFERRFAPLRQEHLQALRQLEQEAAGRPLPVGRIVEAIVAPALRLATAGPLNSQSAMRLIGRIATEPNLQMHALLRSQHAEVRTAFLAAMRRSLPELSEADLQWRFEFVWGALAFVLINSGVMEAATNGICNPADTEAVRSQMVRFFSAGFRAAAAP